MTLIKVKFFVIKHAINHRKMFKYFRIRAKAKNKYNKNLD